MKKLIKYMYILLRHEKNKEIFPFLLKNLSSFEYT